MELQNKPTERIEENLEPLPKEICPECKKKMLLVRGEYKCYKCGITIEIKNNTQNDK
jgi:ssDNA-binding Zn-finger/Zn-ribbon topoisomerase 1